MIRPSRFWQSICRYLRYRELPGWQRELMDTIKQRQRCHKATKRERETLRSRVHDDLRSKFKPARRGR